MKYIAHIKYDGSKFSGFQRLKKEKTVQGEIEKALTKIDSNKVTIKGAGRTDKGAHALNQVIHFDLKHDIPDHNLLIAMNNIVDKSIFINNVSKADKDFHSRYNAKEKTYHYLINIGKRDPINKDYLYNYNKPLNLKNMKKASKYLIAKTSYKAYTTGIRKEYNSKISKIKITKKKEIITIKVTGETFYNHMVRNIVGALIFVGEEKIKPINIKEMLDKEENIYNYPTAPSSGLYLINIKY